MKKILIALTVMMIVLQVFAQSPQKFNYQAICRNSTGTILDSQAVLLRITIHDLSPGGTELYKEIHSIITNAFGLVNIEIGGGTPVSGSFAAIPWANGTKYMEVEMDPGSGYANLGTAQLLSVPYALYASQSGNGGTAGPTGPTGLMGVTGVTGPAGMTGAAGPAGVTGATGAQGMSGPAGATGATGPLVAGSAGQTIRHNGSTWIANNLIYNNGTTVGIGTTSPSAFVDMNSTANGVLFPRMTTVQRDAIVSPAQSLVVYNITTRCFETYIGNVWHKIYCDCDVPPAYAPVQAQIVNSYSWILWSWFAVPYASGYRWSTSDDFNTARELGGCNSIRQDSLTCGTADTIFVWAYNDCGHSPSRLMSSSTNACPCGGITNFTDTRDNTVYDVISIGSQCWMKQNLRFDQGAYGNDFFINNERYYDWAAAMQGAASSNASPSGVQGVCPLGWHLPSDAEWAELENNLGGALIAGGAMKDLSQWFPPNTGATNSSGFSGLPFGYTDNVGTVYSSGTDARFWTTTESNSTNAWYRGLNYFNPELNRNEENKTWGFSVRCIKD